VSQQSELPCFKHEIISRLVTVQRPFAFRTPQALPRQTDLHGNQFHKSLYRYRPIFSLPMIGQNSVHARR
jgi:hypothetical protein